MQDAIPKFTVKHVSVIDKRVTQKDSVSMSVLSRLHPSHYSSCPAARHSPYLHALTSRVTLPSSWTAMGAGQPSVFCLVPPVMSAGYRRYAAWSRPAANAASRDRNSKRLNSSH